jgi:hypothetical protein
LILSLNMPRGKSSKNSARDSHRSVLLIQLCLSASISLLSKLWATKASDEHAIHSQDGSDSMVVIIIVVALWICCCHFYAAVDCIFLNIFSITSSLINTLLSLFCWTFCIGCIAKSESTTDTRLDGSYLHYKLNCSTEVSMCAILENWGVPSGFSYSHWYRCVAFGFS